MCFEWEEGNFIKLYERENNINLEFSAIETFVALGTSPLFFLLIHLKIKLCEGLIGQHIATYLSWGLGSLLYHLGFGQNSKPIRNETEQRLIKRT